MSDYTPTTEEVRELAPLTEEEFDRWLAEVKAQAVAEWRAEQDAKFNKLTVDTLRQGEEQ